MMRTLSTVGLLFLSNIFMTMAWYGHLRFKQVPLWQAILVSWGLAFFEYCLQVPANRIGYGTLTAYQLKILQEVITFTVFIGFAAFALNEQLTWRYGVSMFLILAAVAVAFYDF
ncbi:MAG: DMT family protein [Bdellovibrionales bacterium]